MRTVYAACGERVLAVGVLEPSGEVVAGVEAEAVVAVDWVGSRSRPPEVAEQAS